MQQVGRRHFQTATVVDPRKLPTPIRRTARNRALVGARHTWVLHRQTIKRGLLALVVLTLCALAYQFREDASEAAGWIAGEVAVLFADAGFGVARIEITGQSLTREADIVRALAIAPGATTVGFDAEAARIALEALPSVATATVRKIYPDRIVVTVTENTAVARWRIDGETHLIDQTGTTIAQAGPDDEGLLLVIGHGAADDAAVMINLMNRHEVLRHDLAALSRIADRRWDLIYNTGLRVQLPEHGVAAALTALARYQNRHSLLDRNVELIDMRIPDWVAVRPAPEEDDGASSSSGRT